MLRSDVVKDDFPHIQKGERKGGWVYNKISFTPQIINNAKVKNITIMSTETQMKDIVTDKHNIRTLYLYT